ncbi:CopG family ribbon-helix-helix protein [Methanobacterium ferruginis]|uniref:CopG family ribbon-helix-helix protein n=1 Tax=Methanobacterium ferruginis TaxID=710191 RepID=UPI002573DDCE|nr:CopG family ribbon-helix-helix protein [Methanobacterium ferruginis]BDZ68901.1 nickel-responsive regulator 1 [Methanobacterium ferruginis]
MAIISVSLSEKLLEEIDNLKEEVGFSGRSEVVRASTRLLISDNEEKNKLKGYIHSILILIHPQKSEDKVTQIKHQFEDIINTQIHSHLQENQCLELFILEGDAGRMRELSRLLNRNIKFLYSKLVPLPQD